MIGVEDGMLGVWDVEVDSNGFLQVEMWHCLKVHFGC